jgi:hypothetical protein
MARMFANQLCASSASILARAGRVTSRPTSPRNCAAAAIYRCARFQPNIQEFVQRYEAASPRQLTWRLPELVRIARGIDPGET